LDAFNRKKKIIPLTIRGKRRKKEKEPNNLHSIFINVDTAYNIPRV